jgi:phospholipase/lecithinase/hemolysin
MNFAPVTTFRRAAAALVAALMWAAAAAGAPFNNLVVFGDSLSDIGNISQATFGTTPGQYYSNGRFSNGPVYAELFAAGLGLPTLTRSTAGGNDFAYGGAQTTGTGGFEGLFIRDVDEQVTQFLSSRTASANVLFLILTGANDLNGGQTNVNAPVSSLSTSINRLVTAGARQFLVLNLPPLGDTPQHNGSASTRDQYDARSQQFNTALANMLDGVRSANPSVTISELDVFSFFNRVLADPQLFGFVNVTSSAAPGLQPGATSYNTSQIAANANQYLFWDDLHPTAAAHAVLAQRALDLFRLPGDFNRDNVDDAADYVLWRNGQGSTFIPYDQEIWRAHFGELASTAGAGSTPVPEPSTAIIWVLVAGMLLQRRRL